MTTMRRTTAAIAAGIIALALLGCQNNLVPTSASQSAESGLTLKVTYADFENHLLPNVVGARILDPTAMSFRVTITGPGISPPIVKKFTKNPDPYQGQPVNTFYTNVYTSNGSDPVAPNKLMVASLYFDAIPTGMDRQFFVEALSTSDPDSASAIVRFSGKANYPAGLNRHDGPGISLVPVIYTDMPVTTKMTGIAPSKEALYYRLAMTPDNAWYIVNLKSSADVDLYVASPWNDWYWSWFQQQQVNEGVMVKNDDRYGYDGTFSTANYWYVAVYNNSAAEAAFTVQATMVVPEALDGYNRGTIDPSTVPFTSIANDTGNSATGVSVKELLPNTYGSNYVDLSVPFVYNGTSYSRVYISPNGYVTFWPFGFWYDWWYFTSPLSWWAGHTSPYSFYVYNSYFNDDGHWWSMGNGSNLPNELISLGRRPYFSVTSAFDPNLPADKTTRIVVKQDTVPNPDPLAAPLHRVTIEFRYLYAWYGLIGSADTNKTKYLSGQIVLTDNPYDPGYDGTIDLRYDRTNSDLSGTGQPPFIGLENNVGDELNYPNSFPPWSGFMGYLDATTMIPLRDIRFSSMLGGIQIGAE